MNTPHEGLPCPNCGEDVPEKELNQWFAARAGRATSEKKKRASILNGKKGGRRKNEKKGNDAS